MPQARQWLEVVRRCLLEVVLPSVNPRLATNTRAALEVHMGLQRAQRNRLMLTVLLRKQLYSTHHPPILRKSHHYPHPAFYPTRFLTTV
jgi:hypothetical protein